MSVYRRRPRIKKRRPIVHTLTPPASIPGTTLELQVGAETDDGDQDTGGTMNLNRGTVRVRVGYDYGYLRFTGAADIQGTTITSATLEVWCDDASFLGVDFTIYGEDIDSAPTLVGTNNNIGARTKTTANVAVSDTFINDSWNSFANISTVLQEIADRASFSGELGLILDNTANNGNLQFDSYNSGPAVAAKLTIIYRGASFGARIITLITGMRIFGVTAVSESVVGGGDAGSGLLPGNGANGFGFKGFVLPDNEYTLVTMTSAGLTALISTAVTAGGGTINIPAGDIGGITTGVQFPQQSCKVWIKGAGEASTSFTAAAGLNTNIFRLTTGTEDVAISDLSINGNNIVGSIRGISFGTGTSNVLAQNITVFDCENTGIAVTQSEKVTVRDCTSYDHNDGHAYTMGGDEDDGADVVTNDFSFYNNVGYGIGNTGKYALDCHGNNGEVWGNNLYNSYRVFKVPDVRDLAIYDNTFTLSDGGGFIGRMSDDYVYGLPINVTFTNNTFDNPSGSPISSQYAFKWSDTNCIPTFDNNTYTGFVLPLISNPAGGNCFVPSGSIEDTEKLTYFSNPSAVTTV